MTESLLSFSGIKLFGHQVEELSISAPYANNTTKSVNAATTRRIRLKGAPLSIDGVTINAGDEVLVWKQNNPEKNDVYEVKVGDWEIVPVSDGTIVIPSSGTSYGSKSFLKLNSGFEFLGDDASKAVRTTRLGANNFLQAQIDKNGSRFARIYGFSFENFYYDLPRPVLFLVHGEGALASDETGRFSPARSAGATSLTGIAAADFDFADDLRVWSYDKADYTIRMDVETGMFEDVLLAAMLGGGPGGMDSAGMNARGMNARGMNARGMNARGMNARGMNARGGGNSD